MNGKLHQTVYQELAKQYRDDLQEQAANARLIQVQSKPKKLDPIRNVKRLALKTRVAVVTTIITLTVLLIAQNAAVAVIDGSTGFANNLVI